jgi:hypothetical protein
MPFNRTKLCVAAGLLGIVLASQAMGQGPLGFQLFAPADTSTYGGAQMPNQGYFFQYDAIYWSIQAPNTQVVGLPGQTETVFNGSKLEDAWVESNTLDTSGFKSEFEIGSRFEFGRVEDRNGWFVSIFQLRNQGLFTHADSANIVFNDQPQGLEQRWLEGAVPVNPTSGSTTSGSTTLKYLPTTVYNVEQYNIVSMWGVEANYLHQMMECHSGGIFEFFGGPRYMEFNDRYGVQCGSAEDGQLGVVPDFLRGSNWDTEAQNHIVGAQLGGKFSKKQGRWTISTEGRFTAGLNCQNVRQSYVIGPELQPYGSIPTKTSQLYTPSNLGTTSGTNVAYAREFSPIVELRVEAKYQITRALSFRAGWTGMWMDGIARASALDYYNISGMQLNMAHNKQDVFVNGLNLGFDINR